jgi:hypothetical protein
MEALGHLIFEFFKIGLLSFGYAWIIRYVLQRLRKDKPVLPIKKLMLGIAVFLFLFMCTPYGNHGLGDSARIPVGWSNGLSNVDWRDIATLEDVETSDENQLQTTAFLIKDGYVCGNLSSDFYDYNNVYFVYNSGSDVLKEFASESDYMRYGKENKLPEVSEFKSFEQNYHDYWSGWRFFLLP